MTDDILFAQEGQLGIITLNRPSALNALSLSMIIALQQRLELWKSDDSIKAVVIRAVPGNAFCAGGDVRWLYQSGRSKENEQMQFFWHEYRLNYYIHHFEKPFIALMDGITMGGGVGISLHGSHPVASERFVFAMPETSIGFFPDIGASYLLNRCPGSLGIYLGLTGNRLGPWDSLKAQLIKHVVPSNQMNHIIDVLSNADLSQDAHAKVTSCLEEVVCPSPESEVSQIKPLINVCFAHPTVELIISSLSDCEGVWAAAIEHSLSQKSPLSLKVTLAQLHRAKRLSLAECLKMDFDLVGHFMKDSDFYEGVRSLLITKSKNPQWKPQHLGAVTDSMVINYFEHGHTGLELMIP